METIIEYFQTIPALHRSLILAGGIFFFYMLEYIIPYLTFSYRKIHHAGVNLFFTGTTIIVNFALAFVIVWACDLVTAKQTGILYLMDLPGWLFIFAGLLLLDLIGAWLVHYLQHKIKWMWQFHLVHHTDTNVDTTTANRHHPGESVIRFIFLIIAILITGAPVWMVMLYQSLSAVFSQFNHSNINLPGAIDKLISYVFVSPNMHKVHHHYVQPYTDTNYANIFSIWDRIFGTFRTLDRSELKYGIDTHMQDSDHAKITALLKIPFKPYRHPPGSKFENE